MKNYRPEKLGSLMQELLGGLLLRELDMVGTLVTIASVTVSERLEGAKVKVIVFPKEKGPEVLAQLLEKKRNLQWQLLKKMSIRAVPPLVFELEGDEGLEDKA